MAGRAQASTAHQTMKFVYSEAVNRAIRQRCRGQAPTTTDDDAPPLPPELLLAVLQQSGEVDLGVVSGKSGRPPTDADATSAATAATVDVDYEISNIADIYREISSAIEHVRRRSAANDASGSVQHDRPVTRATATAANKISTATDEKNKASTDRLSRQAAYRTTGKDSDKRQKDARKVQLN